MSLEETYLDDLKNLDPLEAAIKAQREYKAMEAEFKSVKERRDYTRQRLTADLERRGRDRDGNDDGSVKLTKTLKNKVTDRELLIEHIYGLDEPASTYLMETFRHGNKTTGIADPLDRLVAKAVEQAMAEGKAVADCLPPGLDVRTESSIRITLKKQKAEKELTGQAALLAQLDGELE